MARVTATAVVGGFIYTFPLHPGLNVQKLKDIENMLLPVIEYLEKEVPGDEEIFINLNKDNYPDGMNNALQFSSPSIPEKEILKIFDKFKARMLLLSRTELLPNQR